MTRIFLGASAIAMMAAAPAFAQDDEAQIRAMYEEAMGDWEACDMSNFGEYSAETHTAFYPDSKDVVMENSPEAEEMANEFCDGGGKHEMDYMIDTVDLMDDVALVYGSGHYKRTEPGGDVSVDSDFTFTDVLQKDGDDWKFRHTHVGAVMPDMMAEAENKEERETQ